MTENEQVQEMAITLHEAREHLCVGAECEFYMYPIESFDCRELWNAKKLIDKGYRKLERGKWVDKPTGAYGRMQSWCVACGQHSGIGGIESNRHKAFCPNCGADMRGEKDEN